MIALAKVISSRLDNAMRWVKVNVFGDKDTREVDEASPFGVDGCAPKDMIAVYADTASKDEKVVMGYINVCQKAQPGEIRIYSTRSNNATSENFYILLTNVGTCEIGGTADNMVRYSKLEDAYNQLKSDHDDLVQDINAIKTVFASGWVVAPNDGGAALKAAAATWAGQALSDSTGDITPAKIEEIKTL